MFEAEPKLKIKEYTVGYQKLLHLVYKCFSKFSWIMDEREIW
jgi:hypothetical protein